MMRSSGQRTQEDLAVVVAYYDGDRYIAPCIESLLQGTVVPAQIIIVDNCPYGLPDVQLSRFHTSVTVIRTKTAIGFGRAINTGIDRARETGSKRFIVLNQDIRLHPRCIAALLETLDAMPQPALVMARQLEYEDDTPSAHFDKYFLKPLASMEDAGQGIGRRVNHVDRMVAACIAFGLEVCDKVGLFDPLFYMYGEDDDLSLRLKKVGGSILLDMHALVHHRHSLVNAEGEQRQRISVWQWTSRILLRIRYTAMSRTGFVLRMLLFTLRTLTGYPGYTVPLNTFVSQVPHVLRSWSALKTITPNAIHQRVQQQIVKDRV